MTEVCQSRLYRMISCSIHL